MGHISRFFKRRKKINHLLETKPLRICRKFTQNISLKLPFPIFALRFSQFLLQNITYIISFFLFFLFHTFCKHTMHNYDAPNVIIQKFRIPDVPLSIKNLVFTIFIKNKFMCLYNKFFLYLIEQSRK